MYSRLKIELAICTFFTYLVGVVSAFARHKKAAGVASSSCPLVIIPIAYPLSLSCLATEVNGCLSGPIPIWAKLVLWPVAKAVPAAAEQVMRLLLA